MHERSGASDSPTGREPTPSGRIRVVVFGTPAFAAPTLERIAIDGRFQVVLVVTQPDRPAGRSRRPEPPPVKLAAERLGLAVYQPLGLRGEDARRPLVEAEADLFVVAAYGLIFGRKTLAIPRLGCVNVHASLLPRYRGASPVAAAILAGDDRTGISLMVVEAGLDTGPVLATAATAIDPNDTTASLTERLADFGAALAVDAIPRFVAGDLSPRPQPTAGASICRPLIKADGWLDWTRPAAELERRVRAMWPWPRGWTSLRGEPLQIHHATVVGTAVSAAPGTVFRGDSRVCAVCGADALALDVVQPAGGRSMPGVALMTGRRLAAGDRLGDLVPPTVATPIIAPVAGFRPS